MSDRVTVIVDSHMYSAMDVVYDKLYREVLAGHLDADDVERALWVWGDGVAEGWHNWCAADG